MDEEEGRKHEFNRVQRKLKLKKESITVNKMYKNRQEEL